MRYEKGWARGAPLIYTARLFRGDEDGRQMWHCDIYPLDLDLLLPTQVKGRTPALALRAAERYVAWYGFEPALRQVIVRDAASPY